MVTNEESLQLILGIPFFSKCEKQSLSRLLPSLSLSQLEPGDRLYSEGQKAEEFFWVLSGKIGLETANTGTDIEVDKGFCGAEAALGLHTYNADAFALTETNILAIPRSALGKLLSENPQLGMDFFRTIANSAYPGLRKAGQVVEHQKIGPISLSHAIGWGLTLLGPLLLLWLLPEYGFSRNQTAFLAILTSTVIMWVFDLADVFIPSLFMVLAILVFGLAPQEVALAGFASDSLFMAMSVLGLGTLIVASGLSYRFLLWILKVSPRNQFFFNFNLVLTGIILSPLLPSINGRVAIMVPVLLDTIDLLNARAKSAVANRLAVSTFVGVSLFSPIFMTSKSTNFIIFGLLSAQYQQQFGLVYWSIASVVVGLSSLVLYALSVAWAFRNQEHPQLSKEILSIQLKILGPMSYPEQVTMIGIGLFILGGLSASLHHIEPAWLALTLLFALLLSGSLDAKEFRRQVDWPFLIFLGSTIGMVKTMSYLQLDDWLSGHLAWMGSYMTHNLELFILMLTLTLFIIRLAVPITATIVITATVFMPLAEINGINPWLIGFFILVLGENFYLPYQSSYYIQFKSLTNKAAVYDERRFLWFNAWITLVKVLTLYISLPFWNWLGII